MNPEMEVEVEVGRRRERGNHPDRTVTDNQWI